MYMYLRVSMGSFHERAFHNSLYDRTLLNCQCQASQENFSYHSFSTDIWSLLSHERHDVWNGRQLSCLFNSLFSISRRKQPSSTLTVMSKGVCVCVCPPAAGGLPRKGQLCWKIFHIVMSSWHRYYPITSFTSFTGYLLSNPDVIHRPEYHLFIDLLWNKTLKTAGLIH